MSCYEKEMCKILMELDKEFDRITSEVGLKGWVSHFAEDGAMVPSKGEIIKGKEAIEKTMSSSFSLKNFSLRWKPENAEISEDATLGYTYGSYLRTYTDKDNNLVSGTGRYTSVWKKQKDGSYKIILDIGN